ncbi:unnamed protein product [Rotaria magnacalcarata]|uniref:Uncharacterized protein n=1 Tax=Rotaria magnacalcarata TaxID=392030 RepID=A0A818XHG6_9BILA|nr:unnamed protein product [Rotaria magnacalcarata]CAF2035952.1 unnamed protein product [Rotaria magnacalcarata]CAF2037404.1 unnamed protein product [Rotaria magnacalcarata]CAF2098344.1 unnamed protein product [Rotaria magnacalcarata]CAF3722917.1 unnamed protein product [Rotaria magnacalcarata]
MPSFSSYLPIISIIIISLLIIIALYYIRLNYIHRQVLPYSMEVFIIAQSDQHRSQCSQMIWESSLESPPPSYHTMTQSMNTSDSAAYETK